MPGSRARPVRGPYHARVIEPIEGLADGVIGMRAVGTFSVDDYVATIEPEVDRLEAELGQLRLLLHLGPEFAGFGDGEWGELTKELRHTSFHRGAVVTDDSHIRTGRRAQLRQPRLRQGRGVGRLVTARVTAATATSP